MERPYSQQAAELLRGAIDIHIHASPDVRPRKWSYLELAKHASKAGMAGVVIKSHHTITADIARLVTEVTSTLRVEGGVTLNRAVGGFNTEAVKTSFTMRGRFVWFPTLDAANEFRLRGEDERQGFTIFAGNGDLRADVMEILKLIAAHDAILCTGHLSVAETVMLIEAAQACSVKRILVNHPEHVVVDMDLATQKDLAARGVWLERAFPRSNFTQDMKGLARIIREVGVDSSIIGTDLGQPEELNPVAGLATFIDGLMEYGFSAAEVKHMTHHHPRQLLSRKDEAVPERVTG